MIVSSADFLFTMYMYIYIYMHMYSKQCGGVIVWGTVCLSLSNYIIGLRDDAKVW